MPHPVPASTREICAPHGTSEHLGAKLSLLCSTPPHPRLGMAEIFAFAMAKADLAPACQALIARAQNNPSDIDALMDLSVALEICGSKQQALAVLDLALSTKRLHRLTGAPGGPFRPRILVLACEGNMQANMPYEFFLRRLPIDAAVLYVKPGMELPKELPEHDAVLCAICQHPEQMETLTWLSEAKKAGFLPSKWIGDPSRISRLERKNLSLALAGCKGVWTPAMAEITREQAQEIASERLAAGSFGIRYPLAARPLGSQAGYGLEKLDKPSDWTGFLERQVESSFYACDFVDYRAAGGFWPKMRICFIDGKPFASHLSCSDGWISHYVNSNMEKDPVRRDMEMLWMKNFHQPDGFACAHAQAIELISSRLDLDYHVMDCAVAHDGRLVVFETDNGGVVHSLDNPDIFPYKAECMERIYAAFWTMLIRFIEGEAP